MIAAAPQQPHRMGRPDAFHGGVAADQRQADYFVRMLTESCRLIDQRIDRFQRELALVEAAGDVNHARRYRRKMCGVQRDRQALETLVDNLRRRFPVGTPD
jgi:hypothetical protein